MEKDSHWQQNFSTEPQISSAMLARIAPRMVIAITISIAMVNFSSLVLTFVLIRPSRSTILCKTSIWDSHLVRQSFPHLFYSKNGRRRGGR